MNTLDTVVLSTISELLQLPHIASGPLQGAYTTNVRRDSWEPQKAEVEFLTTDGHQVSISVHVSSPMADYWASDLNAGPAEVRASGDDDD